MWRGHLITHKLLFVGATRRVGEGSSPFRFSRRVFPFVAARQQLVTARIRHGTAKARYGEKRWKAGFPVVLRAAHVYSETTVEQQHRGHPHLAAGSWPRCASAMPPGGGGRHRTTAWLAAGSARTCDGASPEEEPDITRSLHNKGTMSHSGHGGMRVFARMTLCASGEGEAMFTAREAIFIFFWFFPKGCPNVTVTARRFGNAVLGRWISCG